MLEKHLLDKMAKVKAEIQGFQLWIDDARTNRIARIRYKKVKERFSSEKMTDEYLKLYQKIIRKK